MATATQTTKQLMELETLYRDAMTKGDTATLERLTADPCIVVGAQGVNEFRPNQLARTMANDQFRLKSYKVDPSSVHVRELGDGIASVAYKVHEEYDRAGKAWKADAYNSSVWLQKGQNWECAVHSESLIEPPR